MNRRSFNVAALLSALLFAWACWAWVRSYQPRHLAVEASEGRVFLIFWESPGRPLTVEFWPGAAFAREGDVLWEDVKNPRRDAGWEWLGFGFKEGRTPSIPLIRMFAIPCWFIVVLTAVIPGTWVAHTVRRRRRVREHRCLKCGYDLRASGERCPECGTAVAPGAAEVAGAAT